MAVSSAAFAAASIRNVGGAGTYPSAASATSATTEARSGSLRTSGTYVRPTTKTSNAAKSSATGGSSMTLSSSARTASAPRLSIGKYVGVPKSISSPGSGGTDHSIIERIESIENTISILENTKQEIIRGSDYIIVDNNEVILNVEKLAEDLETRNGEDGRPVELDADNNEGIKWRYVARDGESEDTWKTLVTWSAVADRIDLTEMNTYVDNSITNLKEEIQADLAKKVDKEQGVQYAGQVLTVDATGHVTPGNVVYSTTEVDQFIENIGDDLDTKVDKAQGVENKGKVLVVGNDGNVTTGDVDIPDVSGKVDVAQGSENAGKLLLVNNSGNVDLSAEPLGDLAYKDKVSEDDITDGSVTRAKAAEDIVGVLDWAEWWKERAPDELGENVLLSIDKDGNQTWFYVVE